MSIKKEGRLTDEQALSATGCGADTPKPCFSLRRGKKGFECLIKTNPQAAAITGIKIGWRVNIDEIDGRIWCPLGGIFENSKSE